MRPNATPFSSYNRSPRLLRHLLGRQTWGGVIALIFACSASFATTHIHKPSSTGKDYYIVFPKAAWGNQSVGILVNSPTKQKVTVTTPTGAKGIIDIKKARTTQYYAGQFRIESIPGYRPKEATRVQSPYPINIHGQFGLQGISGTYTPMPVSSWDTNYYAVAPPEGTNTDYYYYPTIYSVPMITIIASRPGTTIRCTPTAPTSMDQEAGVPFTVSMPNAGDVYCITTQGDPQAKTHHEYPCNADLSGTHITSNYPIGVLVSQSHSTWPCGDNECGDYCVEWLPPVSVWDSEYVIMPSVPRINGAVGEAVQIVFGHNGTDLTVNDGINAPRVIGTYAAGDVISYPGSVANSIVLSGSKPFLPVEITRKPQSCFVGNSGGENWTLGMTMIAGVHQWSDHTPFSTAITSASSIANIFYKLRDAGKIRLNGKPITQTNPVFKILPLGYATMNININAAEYNELTGDSGATAGGSIFGYGTLRFAPGSSGGLHVQDPEVIKSFCHPMGMPQIRLNDNTTVPGVEIESSCGHWNVTATAAIGNYGDGMADISLLYESGGDSSFNVRFNPAPSFEYGVDVVKFGIDVQNVFSPARAMVRVTDRAGNTLDTALVFNPAAVSMIPSATDLGLVPAGDSKTVSMTLRNSSPEDFSVTSYRLRFGNAHHWNIVAPSPSQSFVLHPNDSAIFTFRYTAPNINRIETDDDTFYIKSCSESAVATLMAKPALPGISFTNFDFGDGRIDTLGQPGDLLSSMSQINGASELWVTNSGAVSLQVSGLRLVGSTTPPDTNYPRSDFTIGRIQLQHGGTLDLPTPQQPWNIQPQETVFVEVLAHPTHSGLRTAYLVYGVRLQSDEEDSARIDVYGVRPSVVVSSINYGERLYGTAVDSFFVIHNIGHVNFSVREGGIVYDSVGDSASFVMHNYRDLSSSTIVYYDSTQTLDIDTAGSSNYNIGRIPYRFIAKKPGTNVTRLAVLSSLPMIPTTTLRGTTIQPHLSAGSACPPEHFAIGDTLHENVVVWNSGTDSMQVEDIDIGGDHGGEWMIENVTVPEMGITVPSPPWTFPLRANGSTGVHRAIVTLRWIPTETSMPSTQLHLVGHDRLGRHSADSVSGTFYAWSAFPYDTTLPILHEPCVSGVNDQARIIPRQNILWPNYPNPFKGTTTSSYTIATPGMVTMLVRNVIGEIVQTVVREYRGEGNYAVQFKSEGLPAGMYCCEMSTGGSHVVREMIVLH